MPIRTPPPGSGHFGQGISYPLQFDTNGRLALSYGPQSVKESLLSIMQTVLGERMMQPDYGIGAAFEPINNARITEQVKQVIADHEPRIDPNSLRIQVTGSESQGEARVEVYYELTGDATPQTLTFPFFAMSS